MNEFDNPEDYAAHLLSKQRTAAKAIQHVLDTHGVHGRMWRDTIRVLLDAAAYEQRKDGR